MLGLVSVYGQRWPTTQEVRWPFLLWPDEVEDALWVDSACVPSVATIPLTSSCVSGLLLLTLLPSFCFCGLWRERKICACTAVRRSLQCLKSIVSYRSTFITPTRFDLEQLSTACKTRAILSKHKVFVCVSLKHEHGQDPPSTSPTLSLLAARRGNPIRADSAPEVRRGAELTATMAGQGPPGSDDRASRDSGDSQVGCAAL